MRRRKRQEGAIYVEALIVIGLIVVAMHGTWSLYQFCLYQHRAQLEARAAAWETALQGCGTSQVGSMLSALSKSADGNDVDGLRKDTDENPPGWAAVQRADDGSVTIDLPALLLGRGSVTAKQNFACNEAGKHRPLEIVGASGAQDDALGASNPPDAAP